METAAMYERPASTSSYFARPPPPSRLLLRVYAAEGLRHVSAHGSYCKLYVASTEMVRGSGAFARLHSQKLSASASTHSLTGLVGGNSSRGDRVGSPSPPGTSSSLGDLSAGSSRMRVLKTQVQKGKRPNPVWNEKFDIPVLDPSEDVLSIRVKSARLMSSPAIGTCSIPLKHLALQGGAATVDRWVNLRLGKKDAGRLRLQLRLVDPAVPPVVQPGPTPGQQSPQDAGVLARNKNRDTHLSLPSDDDESNRSPYRSRRGGHKFHRSGRRFDGSAYTVLASASGHSSASSGGNNSSRGLSSSPEASKAKKTSLSPRENGGSATSNESIDDSDVSASLTVSPLPPQQQQRKRPSIEDERVGSRPRYESGTSQDETGTQRRRRSPTPLERSSDPEPRVSAVRAARASFNSFVHASEQSPSPSPPAPAIGLALNASYAHRGTMQPGELERSHMDIAEISSASNPQEYQDGVGVFSDSDSDRDSYAFDEDELDGRKAPLSKRWSSRPPSSVALSSLNDPRESSRMDFDLSDSESEWSVMEDDEPQHMARVPEKPRRHQTQTQTQTQLKEEAESSEDESSEDEDELDEEQAFEMEESRVKFTSSIANVLCRESQNVLMDEEEEEEEESDQFHLSDEFVPILDFSSPASVESVDYALRKLSS